MRTVFIIGGMGAGKSSVAQVLAEKGVPILDLDSVGHAVLSLDKVKEPLVAAFGEGILDGQGIVDRSKLAEKAFCSPVATDRLTQASAPAIILELERWQQVQADRGAPLAAVEVSAYDGDKAYYTGLSDVVIAVEAPLETRLERAIHKGFSADDARSRIARQPNDEQRRRWADHTILNDGNIDHVRTQVEDIWKKIVGS